MTTTTYGIKMDGYLYKVDLIRVRINVAFLYKYAERTAAEGQLRSEALGTYENQLLVVGPGNNPLNPDYIQLYQDLLKIQPDGTYNHTVEVFSPAGRYEFDMYPSDFSIDLRRLNPDALDRENDVEYWSQMELKFTAVNRRE